MNFEEFKDKVTEMIKDFLPEKYQNAELKLSDVIKNNDQHLTALSIHLEGSNIAPSIYLEDYFRKYEQNNDLTKVVSDIAAIQVLGEKKNFDVHKITDFDSIRDLIRIKLISAEKNNDYLADKPFMPLDDLAAVYRIDLADLGMQNASIPITDSLMKHYGISAEELHAAALSNQERLEKPTLSSMEDMMRDLVASQLPPSMPEEEKEELIAQMVMEAGGPMYVLTNEDKNYGASEILNPKAMDMVREQLGEDIYILPSSVHEVIIVPKCEKLTLEGLEAMVQEVNRTTVDPQERLSDHVYSYDAEEKCIVRADKLAEKEQQKEKQEEKGERSEERVSFKEKLAEKKGVIRENEMKADKVPKQEIPKVKAEELA